MSLLKANSIQIGQSNTATNNFTLSAADQNGTIKLSRGNSGATITDVLTINSNGAVSLNNGGIITLGTAVNAATGSPTSIDFTGIPNWVKKVTVMLYGISTNGTSPILIQVGSSSIITSGYSTAYSYTASNGSAVGFEYTDGFGLTTSTYADIAGNALSGLLILSLLGGNIWIGSGNTSINGGTYQGTGTTAGTITLGSSLDRLRMTTSGGTNTFDAGSINIMYEG